DRVNAQDHDQTVLDSMTRLYSLGIKPDWWKLSPMSEAAWNGAAQIIEAQDPHCRGIVLLGLNQPLDQLVQSFRQARHPRIKGFMVGRSIWQDPSAEWLTGRIDDAGFVQAASTNFERLIKAWKNRLDLEN